MHSDGRDPYLDSGVHGWIIATAQQNHWRVGSWYDLADLIQDGYLCYYKCHRHYSFLTIKRHPRSVDRRRFMALVKAAYVNHIHSLANKRTLTAEIAVSQLGDDDRMLWETLGALAPAENGDASFAALVSTSPKEIGDLLHALIVDGRSALNYARSRLRRRDVGGRLRRVVILRRALRQTTNEWCCARLGLDPSRVNLSAQLRQYFAE